MIRRITCLAIVQALLTLGSLAAGVGTRPAHASVQINGAGSTWSQIAVDQFAADVNRQGLNVNYQGVGSTAGRVFYYNDQVDFAVSEIPFTSAYRDSSGTVVTNEIQLASHRPYAYLPIVAGGTSFMYHLNQPGGGLVTTLQLSPDTAAKIFTGVITNWSDPAIKADNPSLQLPDLRITVVVRSDGSGTTAQFTAFMASQTAGVWQAYCQRAGMDPCGPTSLYPLPSGSPFVSQSLSLGVANFVGGSSNNGSITYVEYGYAKQRGFPVASIKNRAGFYTQPTAVNVAIALQGATFNTDGTQNLNGVYSYGDKFSYPVSSYSYMIVPTSTDAPFSEEKGEVLGKFILYFACAGQQKAAALGYSPLPRVLVQNAFEAAQRIPGAPEPPPLDAEHCGNPTLSGSWPPRPVGNPGDPNGNQQTTTTPTNSGTTATTAPTGAGATATSVVGGGTATPQDPANTPGDPTKPQKGNRDRKNAGGKAGQGGPAGPTLDGGTAGGVGSLAGGVPAAATPEAPIGPAGILLACLALLAVVLGPPGFGLLLSRRREAGAPQSQTRQTGA